MKVITTHNYVDFDALASLILAKKIFSQAEILIPQNLNKGVKDFLSLYKDEIFPMKALAEHVVCEDLILVDTQKPPAEIVEFKNGIVFDHHPPFLLPAGWSGRIEAVGATVTLLLQEILSRKLQLSNAERTLTALALYTDTLSFTTTSTAFADIEALFYLWENGFNQTMLQRFANLPLTDKQQDILHELLENGMVLTIKGYNIQIFSTRQDYVHGVNQIIKSLMDIRGADCIFLILHEKEKALIVGRSITEKINVGKALGNMGGGGHAGAASARVLEMKLEDIVTQLKKYLEKNIEAGLLAKHIMSAPVRTIDQMTSVSEAEELMNKLGHNGFVVVDKGKTVGIFSRRDLMKVKKHGLGHAPVKGYMSKKVLSVLPETPVNQIQKTMVEKDIGRLPVIDELGNLKGIVTRTDLLRVYQEEQTRTNP